MYSRVFMNEGTLYKETSLITAEGYIMYEHEGKTYVAKPGKVYLESIFDHPGFNWYLQNYDTAALGSITTVGIQADGDVEFYFDNPENMDAIASHYGLPKPFTTSEVPIYQDATMMSMRFNSAKEAYLYKGYTTLDESGLRPVAKMYIDELDDTLWIYHENIQNDIGLVTKHMSLEKDTAAVIETRPGDNEDGKLYIDGVLYYAADYDYIPHNGASNITLQGDPWTNSNVTKLHE
jgi:hypothetical protein